MQATEATPLALQAMRNVLHYRLVRMEVHNTADKPQPRKSPKPASVTASHGALLQHLASTGADTQMDLLRSKAKRRPGRLQQLVTGIGAARLSDHTFSNKGGAPVVVVAGAGAAEADVEDLLDVGA